MTLLYVESHFLTFNQCAETFTLDSTEVNEYVVAAVILSDEAVTLGVIEPFNSTRSHLHLPLKQNE